MEKRKLTWGEFVTLMYQHNKENHIKVKGTDKHPLIGVVVYKQGDYFKKEYTETERSYRVSSDNKYFIPQMCGNSIFGNCLDGQDIGVRLDYYMNCWNVDYCYIEGEEKK